MSGRTGRFAMVNGVGSLLNWALNDNSAPQSLVVSNTDGGTARRPGNRSWGGSWSAKGGLPSVLPGESFTFSGYTAPTSGVKGGDGNVYSGSALVDSAAITWNWETGEVIAHQINFSGDGALSEAVTAAIEDATALSVCRSRDVGYMFGTEDDLPIKTAVLTITAANQKRNDAQGAGWELVEPGNIDFTLAATFNEDVRESFGWTIGDDIEVKLYTTATLFWELKWAQLMNYSGLTADRSGTIIGMTANFGMNSNSTSAIGHILKPGGTQYWPASGSGS